MLGHQVVFEVDSLDRDSITALPVLKQDNRNNWFVMKNHDFAREELGPKGSSSRITLTIKEFHINYEPGTDVWNTAKLVSVQSK